MTSEQRDQLRFRRSKSGRSVSTLACLGFVNQSGLPRNPVGRTGMCGRGLLGRYGPNFVQRSGSAKPACETYDLGFGAT